VNNPKLEIVALKDIDTSFLKEDPIRYDKGAVGDLVDSIGALDERIPTGLIQPIVLNRRKGQYFPLAGRRRITALLVLGKHDALALVYDNMPDSTAGAIDFAENEDRRAVPIKVRMKELRKLRMGSL